MTVKEIEAILDARFAIESDREYWVEKLKEAKKREVTAAENKKYFWAMAAYNR